MRDDELRASEIGSPSARAAWFVLCAAGGTARCGGRTAGADKTWDLHAADDLIDGEGGAMGVYAPLFALSCFASSECSAFREYGPILSLRHAQCRPFSAGVRSINASSHGNTGI